MIKALSLLLILLISTSSIAEQKSLGVDKVKALALNFIEAAEKREQPTSSVKDIEMMLSLYAGDFQIDHAKQGLTFTERTEVQEHAGANAYRGGWAPGDKEPNRMNTINTDKPLSNLYVTMLQKLGVKTKSFADSTGVIRGI